MSEPIEDEFFSTVPVFSRFEGVTDNGNYRPLPDDWHLALADIVSSTQAIAAGRYKAVNMAGASVISAIVNALGKGDYPFVFGGDGAMVAIPAVRTAVPHENTRTAPQGLRASLPLAIAFFCFALLFLALAGLLPAYLVTRRGLAAAEAGRIVAIATALGG